MPRFVQFILEHGDITTFDADVIALKYAQFFYGADKKVADKLADMGVSLDTLEPNVGTYRYTATNGAIATPFALFVGVPALYQFSYPEIRQFAAYALRISATEAPTATHLAMTIHGPGYGLDETEACFAQLEGYLDAIRAGQVPLALKRITIVDRDQGRIKRLRTAVEQKLASTSYAVLMVSGTGFFLEVGRSLLTSEQILDTSDTERPPVDVGTKPHVFVAMSFNPHLNDVFYYGIQAPVHAAGFLCERMDHVSFTGEIIDWMKRKIETAALVVADLSGANPNVYLEVGYAWGKSRPTILLAPKVEELAFDVRGHRCLVYDGIRDLEELLKHELTELKLAGTVDVAHA